MYGKRGLVNLAKGLAAIDVTLKKVRTLIETRPTQAISEPV